MEMFEQSMLNRSKYLSFLFWICCVLVLPVGTATADDVPRFDVAESCRRGETIQLGVNPFTACMKQEDGARDELKAQWPQFSQAGKTACIQLCRSGGVAGSYVELLTCLEMKTPETFLNAHASKRNNAKMRLLIDPRQS